MSLDSKAAVTEGSGTFKGGPPLAGAQRSRTTRLGAQPFTVAAEMYGETNDSTASDSYSKSDSSHRRVPGTGASHQWAGPNVARKDRRLSFIASNLGCSAPQLPLKT